MSSKDLPFCLVLPDNSSNNGLSNPRDHSFLTEMNRTEWPKISGVIERQNFAKNRKGSSLLESNQSKMKCKPNLIEIDKYAKRVIEDDPVVRIVSQHTKFLPNGITNYHVGTVQWLRTTHFNQNLSNDYALKTFNGLLMCIAV